MREFEHVLDGARVHAAVDQHGHLSGQGVELLADIGVLRRLFEEVVEDLERRHRAEDETCHDLVLDEVIDLHDVEVLLLDLPRREFDAGDVREGDADLGLLADEPDAGLHDGNRPFLPLGVLDEHPSPDRGRHEERVQPVGAGLHDDELLQDREDLLNRRDAVDRPLRAGGDHHLVLLLLEIDHGPVGYLPFKGSIDAETVLTDAHRRRDPLTFVLDLYRNRFHLCHRRPFHTSFS